jgi:hypothetical protein
MPILSTKAHKASALMESTLYKKRDQALETLHEYGFSIILHWNQIEAALKLIKYYGKIKNG